MNIRFRRGSLVVAASILVVTACGSGPPDEPKAMPVGKRGASSVSASRLSKAAARPLPPLMATSAGVPGAGAVSSTIEFHSPQDAHFPDQRDVTAPQAWQTMALEGLAI